MKKLMILTLLFPLLAGCASAGTYFKDRALDFTDIFIAEAHWGYGVSAELEASKLIGTVAGLSESNWIGWHGHVSGIKTGKKLYTSGVVLLGGNGYGHTAEKCYLGLPINLIPATGDQEKGKRRYPLIRVCDISAQLFLIAGGMRAGVSPGELIDFLLGWTTLDFAGDDGEKKEKAEQKEEPGSKEEEK
ncbi:MAG: hypothetical protein ACYS8W_15130 [Planctomycetota bacterium]|jgi:hypothetical protein